MTVYFCNESTIDLGAVAIMGVSVKTGETPIGYFGTGLKFAIATLLRTGHRITLTRDGERINFVSRKETIRGEEFDRVVMEGEPLGFTTNLGCNWECWQAYREIVCNCMDEGGTIDTSLPDGNWGTVIAVDGDGIQQCHINRHTIFLQSAPLWSNNHCEIHAGSNSHAFYRGVKAHQHRQASLFTYNLKTALTLTEDRTIKSAWDVTYYVGRLIPTIEDENVVEDVLLAAQGTFEHGLDMENADRPSAAFMAVAARLRNNAHCNKSALRLWQKHALVEHRFEVVELDVYEREQLETSLRLLKRLNCDLKATDFLVVESLGESVFGTVHKSNIVISRRAFDMGARFLASTLYEEWLHQKHNYQDESRDLQNFLFERLFGFVERVCTMETTGGISQ